MKEKWKAGFKDPLFFSHDSFVEQPYIFCGLKSLHTIDKKSDEKTEF